VTNYPPPPQGNYPPAYPPAPHTSTSAVISLIAGILGWVLLPILGPIIAVITGHIAKGEIKRSMGQITGDGLATFGLILGYLQLILACCSICAITFILVTGIGGGIFQGFRQGYF
jgi:hypothetical protein